MENEIWLLDKHTQDDNYTIGELYAIAKDCWLAGVKLPELQKRLSMRSYSIFLTTYCKLTETYIVQIKSMRIPTKGN